MGGAAVNRKIETKGNFFIDIKKNNFSLYHT